MKNGGFGIVRILIGVFLAILVITGCFQLYRYNFLTIKTEDAVMGEMERTVSGTGIFYREEKLIGNDGYQYLDVIRTESERVSANGVIARVYANEESAMVQKDIRNVEKKISAYEELFEHSGSYQTAEHEIISDINSNIKDIAVSALKGHSQNSFSFADELVVNIMKQRIASGDLVSYDSILDGLKAELASLRAKSSGSEKTINSPKSGYFSLHTDGLESKLTQDSLAELTTENFQEILKECDSPHHDENDVGKMVYGNEWSVAIKVKSQDVAALDLKDTVYIRIPEYSSDRIICTVADVRKNGDETVLVLSSSTIDGNILTLRAEEIQLILESHSGIRVHHSALRRVDDQHGVYVKVGLLLRYKKVNILFDDGEYAIVEYNAMNSSGIRLHDQVVYKGSNLYDGKAVS